MTFTPKTDNVDDVMAVYVNEAYGLTLTNKSGAQRVLGEVVVQDTDNDEAFTTTITEGDPKVIGVVAEVIAASNSGLVMNRGHVAAVSGSLLRIVDLAGQSDGLCAVEGHASVLKALVGTAQGISVVMGNLTTRPLLAGHSDGAASAVALLSRRV